MKREELLRSLQKISGAYAWILPEVVQRHGLQSTVVAEGENYHKIDREKAIAALKGNPDKAAEKPPAN